MLPNKKTLLILNPVAGKGRGGKIFNDAVPILKEKLDNFQTAISEYPGHSVDLAFNAQKEGFERIISIGGDGTPFEIINGMYKENNASSDIELAMLPAGTGNSFLRDFPDYSQDRILSTDLEEKEKLVDVIKFSYLRNKNLQEEYYLNILGLGLISEILELTNKRFKSLGALGYSLAALIKIFKGMKNQIQITVDGKKFSFDNSALVISNSKYTGGKMKIAPTAQVNDGQVDIIIFNCPSRIDTIKIFSRIFKGSHTDLEKVKVLRGSKIEVNSKPELLLMADGELLGTTPLKLEVLEKKLKILI